MGFCFRWTPEHRSSIMKTVRDACQLQPNALSIKLSDQIEQLDELITRRGRMARPSSRRPTSPRACRISSPKALPGWREPRPRPSSISSRPWAAVRPTCSSASACSPGIRNCARHTVRACPTHRPLTVPTSPPSMDGTARLTSSGARLPLSSAKADQFKEFWTGGPKAAGREGLAQALRGRRARS